MSTALIDFENMNADVNLDPMCGMKNRDYYYDKHALKSKNGTKNNTNYIHLSMKNYSF